MKETVSNSLFVLFDYFSDDNTDTAHTSDSKQEEKQKIPDREEHKETSVLMRIAAGALVGTVCAPIAAVALAGAAAVGAIGAVGFAAGAAIGAVEAAAAATREEAEAVDHKKITFLKVSVVLLNSSCFLN